MLATSRIRPYFNPWRLINEMPTDWNDQLNDWLQTASGVAKAPLGIWTKDGRAIIALELPGRELSDIEVSVHRDVVTIEARAEDQEFPEDAKFLRRERSCGNVKRQMQLPFELDAEKVEATYERGLLVLRLFAHQSAQPAKIVVTAG